MNSITIDHPELPVPPTLDALAIIDKMLHRVDREKSHKDLVSIDLRLVSRLRIRLEQNPADQDSIKWLRQLTIAWSTRLSGDDRHTFRKLFDLSEKCEKFRR